MMETEGDAKMDWSSLPTDYSKKEEALVFSTTIGLIF
jgi:hypothetical protein